MEFRVLGPLEVVGDDGEAVALGGPRPRAVLAALLVEANRTISVDRLIDAVWGGASCQRAERAPGACPRAAGRARRRPDRDPAARLVASSRGRRARRGAIRPARRCGAAGGGAGALARRRTRRPRERAFAHAEAARLDERASRRARGANRLRPHRRPPCDAHRRARDARRVATRIASASARSRCSRSTAADGRPTRSRPTATRATALDELGLEPSAELRALEQQILRQDPEPRLAALRRRRSRAGAPGRHDAARGPASSRSRQ